MSFDLDRNSWRAFLSGARRQVSYLTGAKGLCDPTDAVKSASMAHLTGSAFEADLTAPVGSHGPLVPVR